jgi:hypothetical protein
MEEEKKNLSPLWQSYKLLDSSIIYVNMFTGKISTQLVEA